jgi:hypothetical protein
MSSRLSSSPESKPLSAAKSKTLSHDPLHPVPRFATMPAYNATHIRQTNSRAFKFLVAMQALKDAEQLST